METNPHPSYNPHPNPNLNPGSASKTSGLAIGSLICGILALCIAFPGLIGLVLGIMAIKQINKSQGAIGGKGLAIGGIVTSGIGVVFVGIGLLASMLLPALAKAKAKANRVKCVNNLGSIGKSLTGFADANSMRLPWQLSAIQMVNHKYHGASFNGSAAINNPGVGAGSAAQIVNIAAMRSELQTPKILVSPSDPDRYAGNEMLQANWKAASEMEIAEGLSYVFAAPGGDMMRPSTVIALTKNIRSDLMSDWAGADEFPVPGMAFAGLNKSQGQLVLSDGSAKQSSNADLGMAGRITKAHVNSRGGQYLGSASPEVLR